MTTKVDSDFSQVTAILPVSKVDLVTEALLEQPGAFATTWQARGTLLREHWWQKYLPPISPAKSILQFLAPTVETPKLVSQIVEAARLHQQSTGAVFSNTCGRIFFGSAFPEWPTQAQPEPAAEPHNLTDNLNVLLCTVSHHLSPRVSKAAIDAGAHGPIVYYSEGRGLRDRLGWLRITKDHEKEVLLVIAEEENAQRIFDAMASAGELHLPGRGFMYRLTIDRGMFHLASRVSHHHHRANMQQIIRAIDHLSGHTHWRDQAVVDVGHDARAMGIDNLSATKPRLSNQVRFSAICPQSHCDDMMDFLLDGGAPGLSVHLGQTLRKNESGEVTHEEYALLHSVLSTDIAERLYQRIEQNPPDGSLANLCLFSHHIPEVACYVPGSKDYRSSERKPAAA